MTLLQCPAACARQRRGRPGTGHLNPRPCMQDAPDAVAVSSSLRVPEKGEARDRPPCSIVSCAPPAMRKVTETWGTRLTCSTCTRAARSACDAWGGLAVLTGPGLRAFCKGTLQGSTLVGSTLLLQPAHDCASLGGARALPLHGRPSQPAGQGAGAAWHRPAADRASMQPAAGPSRLCCEHVRLHAGQTQSVAGCCQLPPASIALSGSRAWTIWMWCTRCRWQQCCKAAKHAQSSVDLGRAL